MSDSFRSPRRFSRIAAGIAVAWCAGAGAPGAPAAVHRLSDGQAFSTVELSYTKPALTPDGKRVVYCQNAETAGAFALWSVRLAGGAPVRLSGALAGGGLACWFRISPDGTRVVYVANQDSPAAFELYSAPVDGSALAVKLNPALIGNGNVSSDFAISPDSSTVVYRADQLVDDRFDLWSVPIGGGAAVQINGLANANVDVNSFAISPNGLQVAYLADEYDDERFILFARPIGGGALLFIAEVGPSGGDIFEYRFTPDGSWVIFRADIAVDDRIELCRIPTDGSAAATSFGGVPVANGDVFGFAISPDGAWVVHLADLDVDNVMELFTASTVGAVTGQISSALVGGGDVDSAYVISSNGQRVAYVADAVVDGRYELFSVFAGGGAVTPLNPVLPGGSNVDFAPLALPESGRFAYRVIHGFGFGPTELYSVTDDGGGAQLLSPVPAGGSWTALRQVATAGGEHLFFEFQTTDDSATRIYRAAIEGGALIEIGPVLDLASAEAFSWLGPTADPRRALFVSNELTGAETELYAGDICLLCDGFDAAGTTRWTTVLP